MKIIKFALIFLVAAAIFYVGAILLGFNLPKPAFLDKGIAGNAELKVTLLMDNNLKNPLPNIEIDLGVKPGKPPKGGFAMTDASGIATFKVKPGDYVIYFNETAFPKNLSTPPIVTITVAEGVVNEKTILVTTKK